MLISRVPTAFSPDVLNMQRRHISGAKRIQRFRQIPPTSFWRALGPGKRGGGRRKWRLDATGGRFFSPTTPTLWVKNIILFYSSFSSTKINGAHNRRHVHNWLSLYSQVFYCLMRNQSISSDLLEHRDYSVEGGVKK